MNETEQQVDKDQYDDTKTDFDQTSFFDQASSNTTLYNPAHKLKKEVSEEEQKRAVKQKKWILIAGGFFAFLVLFLVIVFMFMMRTPPTEELLEPTPVPKVEKDDFQEKITNAEILLKEADPSLTQDQFPPVDLFLRLDEAED